MVRTPKRDAASGFAGRSVEARQLAALWGKLEKAIGRSGVDTAASRTIDEVIEDASVALERAGRADLMLRAGDVVDPQVVARNQMVTVILRSGPMTLTVKGQALNAASQGQPVRRLNWTMTVNPRLDTSPETFPE